MAQTSEGAKKAAKKNLEKNSQFYAIIGAKGGKRSSTGGFASGKVGKDGLTGSERARKAGALGGRRSRRGPAKSSTSTANK